MQKSLSLILVLLLCMFICACNNNGITPIETTTESTINITSDMVSPIETTVTTAATVTEPMIPEETTIEIETEPVIAVETEPVMEVETFVIGNIISTEFVDIVFNDVTVAKDIKYSVTTENVTRITGPDPISGQQYICLTGTIKNTSKKPLPVYDFFAGKFDIDGYIYDVDATNCDVLAGDGNIESSISPLMEYTLRIYVAIPESLATTFTSSIFHFGFYDDFANNELARNRAFEDDPVSLCPYQYIVKIK